MVCEHCHSRPATLEHRRVEGDRQVIRQVCAHCASHLSAEEWASPLDSLDSFFESLFGLHPRERENVLARMTAESEAVMQDAARLALDLGRGELLLGAGEVLLHLLRLLEDLLHVGLAATGDHGHSSCRKVGSVPSGTGVPSLRGHGPACRDNSFG